MLHASYFSVEARSHSAVQVVFELLLQTWLALGSLSVFLVLGLQV